MSLKTSLKTSPASNAASPAFFEAKYRRTADPWCFETSPYETARYDAALHAISHRRYGRAFEPGCSVGAFTRRLARICDEIVATDVSATAVKIAQSRCRLLPNVRIDRAGLPESIPSGPFDLVVLSEIGYYFDVAQLDFVLWSLMDELTPGGVLLAVHWLGTSPDHRLSGDQVHQRIREIAPLKLILSERYEASAVECYRLDCWERV